MYNTKSYSQCDSFDENFKDFGSEKDSTYSINSSSYVETATAASISLTSTALARCYLYIFSIFGVWSEYVSYIFKAIHITKQFKKDSDDDQCARTIPAKSVLRNRISAKESHTRVFSNIATWSYIRKIVKKVVTPSFLFVDKEQKSKSSGLTCLYFLGFLLFSVLALAITMSLLPFIHSISKSDVFLSGFHRIETNKHLNEKKLNTASNQEKQNELAKLQGLSLSLDILRNDMKSLETLETRLLAVEKSLEVAKVEEKLLMEITYLKKKLQHDSDKMNKHYEKYESNILSLKDEILTKVRGNVNEHDILTLQQGIKGLKTEFQKYFSDFSGYFEEINNKMENFVTNEQLKIDLAEIKDDVVYLNQSSDKVNMLEKKLSDILFKIQSLESMVKDCKNSKMETDKLIELEQKINSLELDASQKNCCNEEKMLALIRAKLKSGEQMFYKDSMENSELDTATDSSKKSCMTSTEVESIVKEVLDIHLADKTGLPDYALESAGGAIIDTRCSVTYTEKKSLYRLFGMPIWYVITSPRAIIQPEMQPGNCWAMKGSKGSVVISLATKISPTSFSLEHISRKLSMDGTIASAPKDFSVIALKEPNDKFGENLGNFTYVDDGQTLQTFSTKILVTNVKYVLLKILSNHGQPSYTCIYRFRVHGKPEKL